MLRVGLTGGIGSGKTTVSNHLAKLGATVIDADVVSRQVVEPGEPALDEIKSQLGEEFIRSDGSLNRDLLKKAIFNSPDLRLKLEAILHPRILGRMAKEADASTGPYVVLVLPLLVEANLTDLVDRVLVVDCEEDTQVARLHERDNLTDDQISQILQAQASRQERLSYADDVITNNDDIDDLLRSTEQIHQFYLDLARKSGRQLSQS